MSPQGKSYRSGRLSRRTQIPAAIFPIGKIQEPRRNGTGQRDLRLTAYRVAAVLRIGAGNLLEAREDAVSSFDISALEELKQAPVMFDSTGKTHRFAVSARLGPFRFDLRAASERALFPGWFFIAPHDT